MHLKIGGYSVAFVVVSTELRHFIVVCSPSIQMLSNPLVNFYTQFSSNPCCEWFKKEKKNQKWISNQIEKLDVFVWPSTKTWPKHQTLSLSLVAIRHESTVLWLAIFRLIFNTLNTCNTIHLPASMDLWLEALHINAKHRSTHAVMHNYWMEEPRAMWLL